MRGDRGSVVLLLVVAALVAAFVGGLWLPRAHRVSETRRRITARETELARLRAEVETAPAAAAPELVAAATARAERAVPARAELGPLLERLSGDLAAEAVLVRQLRAQTPIALDGVEQIPVTLQCEGTYPALYGVLERIATYDRIVRVDALGITGGRGGEDEYEYEYDNMGRGDDKGEGDDDDEGRRQTLLIDIELSTFCRATKEGGP